MVRQCVVSSSTYLSIIPKWSGMSCVSLLEHICCVSMYSPSHMVRQYVCILLLRSQSVQSLST